MLHLDNLAQCTARHGLSPLTTDWTGCVKLRDYLRDCLYLSATGYFQRTPHPIAYLPKPIRFNSLLGRADYLRAVAGAYASLQTAWLTPSEIFTPLYGRAVAAYLLQLHAEQAGPMHIFEIGAGTGTLARDILDHLQQVASGVYEGCEYTSCEISAPLAKLQLRRVSVEAGHGARFRVEVRDASQPGAWGAEDRRPCYMLAMEVLDNCVHDKVQTAADGSWRQEEVHGAPGNLHLCHTPLTDSRVKKVLDMASDDRSWLAKLSQRLFAGTGRCREIFLPTGASLLLETLCAARPNHALLAADFSALPDVVIPGQNAPLVVETVSHHSTQGFEAGGGVTTDRDTYLSGAGRSDIFFPTDFALLSRVYQAAASAAGALGRADVVSNQEFMEKYGDLGASRTRDGYSPLAEDYTNTCFLMGRSCKSS